MSMLSNLELIRRVPLFALLTANQAESVADAVVKRRFKRSEIIVEQGEKSNTLFIILTGRVRVVTSDKRGREVILATLQPGDYIGEMSLIDSEPQSATVLADTVSDVLVLGHHGSKTASSLAFLQALKPRLALVSSGFQNQFGHPAADTQARLSLLQIPLLNTADSGAVRLHLGAQALQYQQYRPRRFARWLEK